MFKSSIFFMTSLTWLPVSLYSFSIQNNPYQYAAQYSNSESGLQYLSSRDYNPALLRFIERDSYRLMNRYNYVDGNPVMYQDPSGHCRYCALAPSLGDGEEEALIFAARGTLNAIKAVDKVEDLAATATAGIIPADATAAPLSDAYYRSLKAEKEPEEVAQNFSSSVKLSTKRQREQEALDAEFAKQLQEEEYGKYQPPATNPRPHAPLPAFQETRTLLENQGINSLFTNNPNTVIDTTLTQPDEDLPPTIWGFDVAGPADIFSSPESEKPVNRNLFKESNRAPKKELRFDKEHPYRGLTYMTFNYSREVPDEEVAAQIRQMNGLDK